MNWDTYHTDFIKVPFIYRYVTLDKLISFLKSGCIWFARMDTFEDNLEGMEVYWISELLASIPELPEPHERNPKISSAEWEEIEEERRQKLNYIKSKVLEEQMVRFVSSWVLGETESIGMWDLYGDKGFCVKFKRDYLQNLVKSKRKLQSFENSSNDLMVAGKVVYQNFEDNMWNEEDRLIKYAGFRKHLAFKHEDEYRFVLHSKNIQERGARFYLGRIDSLEFELIANPRMSRRQHETYQEIIQKFVPKLTLKESSLKLWLEFKKMKSD